MLLYALLELDEDDELKLFLFTPAFVRLGLDERADTATLSSSLLFLLELLELLRDDWMELGFTGIQSAKVIAGIKKHLLKDDGK